MYVSLCGPHSFETSTFGATCTAFWPVHESGPCVARYSYLLHHVGLPGLLLCADAGVVTRMSERLLSNAAVKVTGHRHLIRSLQRNRRLYASVRNKTVFNCG